MIKLRIATFNVENLADNPQANPTIETRAGLMRPQLRRTSADILCLQEVNSLTALDKLTAGTDYAGFHRVSTANNDEPNHGQSQNTVILSRFPIIEFEKVLNKFVQPPLYQSITAIPPETAASPRRWTRAVLHAKVELPGNIPLHVISCHLKSKIPTNIKGQTEPIPGTVVKRWKNASAWAEGAFISGMVRMGQALEVRTLVDTIFDQEPEAMVVVCGDLNATAEEVPIEALRGDVENLDNADLANRVLVPCEQSVPQSARYSLIHRGRGEMLDHILISRALLAFYRTTEIHNELLHDESVAFATDKKFPESDHAPVVAEFLLA